MLHGNIYLLRIILKLQRHRADDNLFVLEKLPLDMHAGVIVKDAVPETSNNKLR